MSTPATQPLWKRLGAFLGITAMLGVGLIPATALAQSTDGSVPQSGVLDNESNDSDATVGTDSHLDNENSDSVPPSGDDSKGSIEPFAIVPEGEGLYQTFPVKEFSASFIEESGKTAYLIGQLEVGFCYQVTDIQKEFWVRAGYLDRSDVKRYNDDPKLQRAEDMAILPSGWSFNCELDEADFDENGKYQPTGGWLEKEPELEVTFFEPENYFPSITYTAPFIDMKEWQPGSTPQKPLPVLVEGNSPRISDWVLDKKNLPTLHPWNEKYGNTYSFDNYNSPIYTAQTSGWNSNTGNWTGSLIQGLWNSRAESDAGGLPLVLPQKVLFDSRSEYELGVSAFISSYSTAAEFGAYPVVSFKVTNLGAFDSLDSKTRKPLDHYDATTVSYSADLTMNQDDDAKHTAGGELPRGGSASLIAGTFESFRSDSYGTYKGTMATAIWSPTYWELDSKELYYYWIGGGSVCWENPVGPVGDVKCSGDQSVSGDKSNEAISRNKIDPGLTYVAAKKLTTVNGGQPAKGSSAWKFSIAPILPGSILHQGQTSLTSKPLFLWSWFVPKDGVDKIDIRISESAAPDDGYDWTLADVSCVGEVSGSEYTVDVSHDQKSAIVKDVPRGDNVLCSFTNNRVASGSFEISKKLAEGSAHLGDLSDQEFEFQYRVGSTSAEPTTVKVKPGEAVKVEGIPSSSRVYVTEVLPDAPQYCEWDRPVFTGLTGSGSNAYVSITENDTKLVTATNNLICDEPAITFGSVSWTKVAAGSNEKLAGSEFSIMGPLGDSEITLEVSDCVASQAEDCEGPDINPLAGEFEVVDLQPGEYRLIETVAPAGYQLLKDPLVFEITADNLHLTLDAIENEQRPPLPLPILGGMGITAFVIAGIAAFGGAGLLSRRKGAHAE